MDEMTIYRIGLRTLFFDSLRLVLVTLVVHLLWRFWANDFYYFPFTDIMKYRFFPFTTAFISQQAEWALLQFPNMDFIRISDTFYLEGGSQLRVTAGCGGLKQMVQFAMVIVFARGKWNFKLCFISMGIILIHNVNILRISLLCCVSVAFPQYWDFFHDMFFRSVFYVVIFLLWICWVEKFAQRKKRSHVSSG